MENAFHLGGERKCISNQSKAVFQESISQPEGRQDLSQADFFSEEPLPSSNVWGREEADRDLEWERPGERMKEIKGLRIPEGFTD